MAQFRPAGCAGNHLTYSPYVLPVVIDGVRGVVVDLRLRDLEPLAYKFVAPEPKSAPTGRVSHSWGHLRAHRAGPRLRGLSVHGIAAPRSGSVAVQDLADVAHARAVRAQQRPRGDRLQVMLQQMQHVLFIARAQAFHDLHMLADRAFA
ncbi:hypothetical protein G6F68_017056 [Rhizopus microsporus]|nr:hypothetical protein G6F68_017056 [Rhizopus microsporus]